MEDLNDKISEKKTEYINKLDQEENKLEEKTEEIAEEMQINIPGQGLRLPIRIIALFTLLGGLSIVGSMFADIVDPDKTRLSTYLIRLIVGLLMVLVAYGILHLKRWSIWLYALIAFIGLTINPAVAVFPIAIVVFLYIKRRQFEASALDFIIDNVYSSLKTMLLSKLGKKGPPTNINREN
jgi:uncharacterized membrane protein